MGWFPSHCLCCGLVSTKHTRMIKLILAVGLLSFSFLIYMNLESGKGWRSNVLQETNAQSGLPNRNMKTILLWTNMYWNYPEWFIPDLGFDWEGHKHTDLRDFGCDHDSFMCTITSNRSYLEDESFYDGILFHQYDINQQDVPLQKKRGGNQVYMFFTHEAPTSSVDFDPNHLNYDPQMNSNFFNVTMTYNSQSEVHIPYGKMVKVSAHPAGTELDLDQHIARYGRQNAGPITRNFSAAILISNCASAGGRENLLAELGQLMPVEIFGGCGKQVGETADKYDEIKLLGKTFPFHLAFENSLCEDYVTERFFHTLDSDMIPVVYNWANMSRIAPKQSYIDVKDFATITDLVNYLQKVYSDPALYASYFWWRDFYEVQVNAIFTKNFVKHFCEACRYLHSGKGPRVVEDMHKEWGVSSCRQPPIIS